MLAMKILVTGGAGFIGSHLVDKLLALGHEVIVVDNLSSGKKENLNPGTRFYEMDIRDDRLATVFLKHKPRLVFHLAAQTSVADSLKSPKRDYSVNVEGSLNLVNLSRCFGVRKLIFTSTLAVYGESQYLPVDESHPLNPISPYGKNKLAAEEAFKRSGIEYTILRCANVYGPRQTYSQEAGVVAIFLREMLKNQKVTIFGDGNQERDFIFVEDAVGALLSASIRGSGQIINIGTGRATSIKNLFEILCSLINYKGKPVYRKRRVGEVYRSFVDVQKARKELDWQAEIRLTSGLKSVISYTGAS